MSSFTLPCPNAVAGSASCRAPPRGRPCAARAAAKEAPPAAPGGPTLPTFYDPKTSTSWHFVLANADFMLNDENSEHLPEVLRERRRFFIENSAPSNFFVVPNPAWLAQQPQLATRVRQPAVAIVSPDAVWIRRGFGPPRTLTRAEPYPPPSDTPVAQILEAAAGPGADWRAAGPRGGGDGIHRPRAALPAARLVGRAVCVRDCSGDARCQRRSGLIVVIGISCADTISIPFSDSKYAPGWWSTFEWKE